jgi:hypothetical protein
MAQMAQSLATHTQQQGYLPSEAERHAITGI